jgi:hypothetical protein
MQRRTVARVTGEGRGAESRGGYTNAATDPRTRNIQTQGVPTQNAAGAQAQRGQVDRVAENETEEPKRLPIVKGAKVRPNDPCPCGSGLKFKKCHGKNGAKRYVPDAIDEAAKQ